MNKQTLSNETLPSTYTFYEDAGHGWLKVPYSAVVFLKLQKLISKYSYRNGSNVYLEEDADAPAFIKSYLKHIGRPETDFQYFFDHCNTVYDGLISSIRNYPSY